jgi:hypothetical protein
MNLIAIINIYKEMWKGPLIAMDTLYPFSKIKDPNAPKHLVCKKIP